MLPFRLLDVSVKQRKYCASVLQVTVCFLFLIQYRDIVEGYLYTAPLKVFSFSPVGVLHSPTRKYSFPSTYKIEVLYKNPIVSSLYSSDSIDPQWNRKHTVSFKRCQEEDNFYPFRIKGISSIIRKSKVADDDESRDDSKTEKKNLSKSSMSSKPKKRNVKDGLKKTYEENIYKEDKDFVKKSQQKSEAAIKMMEAGALSAKQQEIFLGVKPKVKVEKKFEPIVGVTPSYMFAPRDADGELTEASFVYVDEYTCIGCTNCANVAPDAFFMEDEHGRARVFQQWRTSKSLIKEAIETCPVDCIHYVSFEELERLEIERGEYQINPTARLVGNEGINSSTSGKGGPQNISGDRGLRCNNCPSKGCYDCPMFSVGDNPEYKARKAKIDAKKMVRLEEKKNEAGPKKRRRL